MQTNKLTIIFILALLVLSPSIADAKKGKPKKKEISVQLYSLRNKMDAAGTNYLPILQEVSEMGFSGIEAAGYGDGKFYGTTPQEFKNNLELADLKPISSHCGKGLSKEELESGDFTESLKWWDETIAAHKAVGMKYIVTPWMNVPKDLKDLQTYCNYYNEIGKRCNTAGMKYGYHNHAHEFQKIENKVMLEYMIENTNPNYLFFQLDVYWVVMGQNSPVDLFNKYPGRFTTLHIKDQREIGQSGMVGFDAIFNNAQTAGVNDIIVEVERYSFEPEKSIEKSIEYLLSAPFVKKSYPVKK